MDENILHQLIVGSESEFRFLSGILAHKTENTGLRTLPFFSINDSKKYIFFILGTFSRMLLVLFAVLVSLTEAKKSSFNIHQAGCTTEFLPTNIHYYNSMSKVK